MALVVKNPPFNAGDVREVGSVRGSGKSPGGEHGNPLQYSCLENPMDRGDWQAIVNRVTESHTTEVTSQAGTHVYITHLSLDLLPEPPSSSLSDSMICVFPWKSKVNQIFSRHPAHFSGSPLPPELLIFLV